MPGLNYHKQTQVREAVQKYLAANGMTSLRKIAIYVKQETKIHPSASTISRLVRDYGYTRAKPKWVKK